MKKDTHLETCNRERHIVAKDHLQEDLVQRNIDDSRVKQCFGDELAQKLE